MIFIEIIRFLMVFYFISLSGEKRARLFGTTIPPSAEIGYSSGIGYTARTRRKCRRFSAPRLVLTRYTIQQSLDFVSANSQGSTALASLISIAAFVVYYVRGLESKSELLE